MTSNAFALTPPLRTGEPQSAASAPKSLTRQAGLNHLPPEIGFLSRYGVAPSVLMTASRMAREQNVSADRALLANGFVEERFFYQCLARHLGLSFTEDLIRLPNADAYAQAIHAGVVPLASYGGEPPAQWLLAPRGLALTQFLRTMRRGEDLRARFVMTTPANFSRSLREAARRKIAADASYGLLSAAAHLSVKTGFSRSQKMGAGLVLAVALACLALAPSATAYVSVLAIDFCFLAAILFRLIVSACGLGAGRVQALPLPDHELPVYTIVLALYKEARVVRQLVAMLERIDYPRAKLDIKFLIEEDDHETRRALEACRLSAAYEIIVAPVGVPRTKPRALNVALPLARGELITVFDAEDQVDSGQIRLAAERFASAPKGLACLQARLVIENVGDSWLTRLFAIEYATLFEIFNTGLADLDLPFPIGGSSNHFRTSVLREIGGWDAWNVTEDADLGFRLARFGYGVGVLQSVTFEEAPIALRGWMKQRQRWFKGWLQTFVTITHQPIVLAGELGVLRSGALALLLLGQVFGPLLWLPALLLTGATAHYSLIAPLSLSEIGFATLWVALSLFGLGSIVWHALAGMRRQKLLALWPIIPLLLPYYCLQSYAAWIALYEFFRRPFHWHKTEHGLAGAALRKHNSRLLLSLRRVSIAHRT